MRTALVIASVVFVAACAENNPPDAPVGPGPSETPAPTAQETTYAAPAAASDANMDTADPSAERTTEPARGSSDDQPRASKGAEMSTVPDRAPSAAPAVPAPAAPPAADGPSRPDADNTRVNRRDAHASGPPTPMDQGNGSSDLTITQQIRKALMGDESLSVMAKNVKIVTQGGKVTLRGPVKSDQERKAIADSARRVAGAQNVDDQLEVKK